MKRFIFGIIAVIGALLLLGAMWSEPLEGV